MATCSTERIRCCFSWMRGSSGQWAGSCPPYLIVLYDFAFDCLFIYTFPSVSLFRCSFIYLFHFCFLSVYLLAVSMSTSTYWSFFQFLSQPVYSRILVLFPFLIIHLFPLWLFVCLHIWFLSAIFWTCPSPQSPFFEPIFLSFSL